MAIMEVFLALHAMVTSSMDPTTQTMSCGRAKMSTCAMDFSIKTAHMAMPQRLDSPTLWGVGDLGLLQLVKSTSTLSSPPAQAMAVQVTTRSLASVFR